MYSTLLFHYMQFKLKVSYNTYCLIIVAITLLSNFGLSEIFTACIMCDMMCMENESHFPSLFNSTGEARECAFGLKT